MADTDGDSLPDGWEYYFWYNASFNGLTGSAYNPLNLASGKLVDSKVIVMAFEPSQSRAPANRDLDNDGLTDAEELVIGTNPIRWDTDGDGLSDSWETSRGLDPGYAGDAAPIFNPGSGSVATNTLLVRLSTIDEAEVRYTLDGSMPSKLSDLYQSDRPLVLTQSATVTARAFRPGMIVNVTSTATFSIIKLDCVSEPEFTPASGTVFTNALTVALSCATEGATIRYTLDGAEPNTASDEYAEPLALTRTTTVEAKAYKDGMADSAAVTAYYHLATCYYADASRPDDSGDGTGWATAKRSIQAAIDLAYAGDTVWVTNGVYDIGGALTPEFSLSNRVVIAGDFTVRSVNGADVTVIEGSGAECYDTESAMRCVYLGSGVLDGFTLRNGATLSSGMMSDVCGGGVLVADGVVRNCVIRNNLASFGGGVYGGSIENSIVCGNGAEDGAGVGNTLAYNSVIYGNAGTGIQGGALYNCIVWDNETPYSDLNTPFELINCCIASWPQYEGYRNNVSSDPLFVDATNSNFRLRSDSPCRDAGDDSFVLGPSDIAGNPRIANGRVDMGAYESDSITVSLDAGGGTVNISEVTVTNGLTYGLLPTPVWSGYTFDGWWLGEGGTGVRVTSATLVTTVEPHSLHAKWRYGLPPVLLSMSPSANPAPVNEGASAVFSASASDSADPDLAMRGMSNIAWYVDGVLMQTTKTGAPNTITSGFTLRTATNTVVGTAFRSVVIKVVALDRQGSTAETNWTVRVNNVPASQTITFKALTERVLGTTNFNPGATASSGLGVEYASANTAVAEVSGGLIQLTGAGTAVITVSQPGNFDFKAAMPVKQTLTVKARLTAEVLSGAGSVTGEGLYLPGAKVALTAKPNIGSTFLHWEDGSQATARSLVMPNANTTVSAWFGLTTNVPPPVVANPGALRAMVGVPFELPLDIASDSLPTVTVTGLPSGLAYVPATKSVAGVPTASVTNKPVTVKAVNVNKTPGTNTFFMTVDPLPAWAAGTFNGAAGTAALGSGSASLSVTALGAVSGRLTLRGTNFSFNAKSYTSRLGDGSFTLVTTASVGKVSWPLTLSLNLPEVTDTTGGVPPTLSKAVGVLSADGQMALYRDVWKDSGMVTVLTNTWAGYYTAALPGGSEYGSGYLTFTVDRIGGIKTVGKLADGTAVSLAGTLILDEAGRVLTVMYSAPTAYKGGGVFGVAEFFKSGDGAKVIVRLLDGEPFLWESFEPQATKVNGEGFSRVLGLSGGWYDTVGNLYGYYRNRALSTGADGAPVPVTVVGTNRFASVWWCPDSIALAVVTNRSGIMTGLAAPKAAFPKKGLGGYTYDSSANTVGLTIGLTRATGVFIGSFSAWFDYGATHTSKAIAYEGVLTPEREDTSDGVTGRGFFLWGDKVSYLNPQGKSVSYSVNWSYDLKIMLSDLEP